MYARYFFPPWLHVTLLHFSHDRSSWSSASFYSTTFQNFTVYFWSTFRSVSNFSTIQLCSNTLSVRDVQAHILTGPSTVSTWNAQKPPNFGILAMFLVTMRCRKSCYRSLGGVLCFHLHFLLNPCDYKPKIANYSWSVFEHKSHIDRIFYILLILLSHNHIKWTVLWATQVVKIEAAISAELWAT